VVLLCAVSSVAVTQSPPAQLAPLTIDGDIERGRVLAETCSGCHGIPGYRNAYPSYHVPKLGGQNADYLEIALQGYRRGTRPHGTMQAQAMPLSDQDIADLAAFFASLEDEQQSGISRAAAELIRQGQEKSAVCAPCHGEAGISPAPQWPTIAGQHASYLEQALVQYKDGTREDMVMGPMVAALDEETLQQLAAYFAAQRGLHTTDEM
jgi:cytochrome c553